MRKLFLVAVAVFMATSVFIAEPVYANSRPISTSGGNRNTTWVEVSLDDTYIILGLSARDVLGRDTGTISEFAAAMEHVSGTDTIIFPANYFHAYGGPNANDIIGSIISNRQMINESYFDQAVGFRGSNHMFFYELYTAEIGARVMYEDRFINLDFSAATTFAAYPRLIRHGVRLPIQAMPGATIEWQNRRVQRAFMGQRWDGTFVVGNITGANMREVQDVAAYFNLATAVNIDGGASAGLWRNGSYLTRPGRQLASVVFITNNRFNVTLDGVPLAMDAYVQVVDSRFTIPLSAALESFGFTPRFNSQNNSLTIDRGDNRVTYFIGTNTVQVDDDFHTFHQQSLPGGAHAFAPVELIAHLAGINVTVIPESRLVSFTGTVVTEPSGEPGNVPTAPTRICESCNRIFGYCPCPACPC